MDYHWSITEQNKIIHKTALEHNLWIVVGKHWYHPDRWLKEYGSRDYPKQSRGWVRYANPLTALRVGGNKIRKMIGEEKDRLKIMGAHMRYEMLVLSVAECGFVPTRDQKEAFPVPWCN